MSYEEAIKVVRAASAYRMIESGELTRALGLGDPKPSEIENARVNLDDALAEYEAAVSASDSPGGATEGTETT